MEIEYLDDDQVPPAPSSSAKIEYLDEPTSFGQKIANVGMGALETVNAPFQVAGEAIRTAGEGQENPFQVATAKDPRGFRAPSIVQRFAHSLKTPQPPADPFQKVYQGLEGIVNLPRGLQAASDVVTGEPDIAAQIGGAGLALGMTPFKRGIPQEKAVFPKAATAEELGSPLGAIDDVPVAKAPPLEAQPQSIPDIDPTAPPTPGPVPKDDPLKAVNDLVAAKYGQATKTPGLLGNIGKSLEQKSKGMNLKEIGASPGQIRLLRDRYGEGMVNDLADLADKKGITKGFFNWQTGNEIENLLKKSGSTTEALRKIAKERGAAHNPADLIATIQRELDPIFMQGTGSAHKGPYLKALQDIQNSGMDVESLANTISDKNAFIAKNKLTLPVGPVKEVMKIANRLNKEKINTVLNPQEQALLKESLTDYSAGKVFDKMYGFTYGRDMAGRSGPASLANFAKDVGGRKVLQKLYSKVGKGMQSTPDKFANPKNLSSEVLDAIGETLDEVIAQMGTPPEPGMAHGGIVGGMGEFMESKYGKR